MRDLTAMVLCAGLGTRLRPLTDRVPKPAAPLLGVPLVAWTLALLRNAGVQRAVVNTHHLPAEMAAAARAACDRLGMELQVSHEPVIAGTGGALREARALLRDAGTLVVVNGDVLFDLDLPAALEAHWRSRALATMVLLPMPEGAGYNAVLRDEGGAVRRIGEDGPGGEGLSPWHFSGAHVLSPELLDRLPAEPFAPDVNHQVYPPLMGAGLVRGHLGAGYWNDLGTPARYLEAARDVLEGRVRLARFAGAEPLGAAIRLAPGVRGGPGASLAPGAIVEGPCYLGAGARVEAGAEVGPLAVIDAGVTVPAGAKVRRAVVWSGAALEPGEVVEDAVAARGARVVSPVARSP